MNKIFIKVSSCSEKFTPTDEVVKCVYCYEPTPMIYDKIKHGYYSCTSCFDYHEDSETDTDGE